MFRAGRSVNAVMLATGVVLASAGFVLAEAAASQSRSPDLVSATLVLRGSTDPLEHEAAAADGSAPSVLRGSRPSVAQPRAGPYACPAGLEYDPNYGCAWSGFAYSPRLRVLARFWLLAIRVRDIRWRLASWIAPRFCSRHPPRAGVSTWSTDPRRFWRWLPTCRRP